MSTLTPRPVWTAEQLDSDRLVAIEAFKAARLEEPLEDYLEAFDARQADVEELMEMTVDLTVLDDEKALEIVSRPELLRAFRYVAGPPISADDLTVLADATSLSRRQLKASRGLRERLVAIVRQGLDRRRFAWVSDDREATEAERTAAIVASSALMAASEAQTLRRGSAKDQQEDLVKSVLRDAGYVQVPTREIRTLAVAPAEGEFCGESVLGSRRADVVVRMIDGRLLPIECKVSNSSINSVKRLNNDAAAKAEVWLRDFGTLQIVPAAVLSGVYNLSNLEDAQARGLTLFWAHDLAALIRWLTSVRAR